MDMFYDVARRHIQLDCSRRLHFNAAMLEIHSRLHHLDGKRQQRQQQQLRQWQQQVTAVTSSSNSSSVDSSPAGFNQQADSSSSWTEEDPVPPPPTDNLAGSSGSNSSSSDNLDSDSPMEGCYSDAAVAAWFDEGVLRQKEAKAAVLAIRRHLRCAHLNSPHLMPLTVHLPQLILAGSRTACLASAVGLLAEELLSWKIVMDTGMMMMALLR
jgi:hypothetical protein